MLGEKYVDSASKSCATAISDVQIPNCGTLLWSSGNVVFAYFLLSPRTPRSDTSKNTLGEEVVVFDSGGVRVGSYHMLRSSPLPTVSPPGFCQ